MIKYFALSLLAAFVSLCVNAQNGKYTLTGKLSGFADSTMLILDGEQTTYIINNQFRFTGTVKEGVKQVLIKTPDYSDYKLFWLTNAPMTFTAEKGKFKEAVITGSKVQQDNDKLNAAIKASGKDKEESITFIKKHPGSLVSAHVLSVYAAAWGKDTTAILYNVLSREMKNTEYGKKINDFVAYNKNIKVGDKYADFTLPDVVGKNVSLSDFKGKVVLLDFWGSWCHACREANPDLVKIYNEFKDSGFEILGVANDENKEAWLEAIKKDGLTWTNVNDFKGSSTKPVLIYGIMGYPTNYLIDKNGVIVAIDVNGEKLKAKLSALLL